MASATAIVSSAAMSAAAIMEAIVEAIMEAVVEAIMETVVEAVKTAKTSTKTTNTTNTTNTTIRQYRQCLQYHQIELDQNSTCLGQKELPGSLGNLQDLTPGVDFGNHSFSLPPYIFKGSSNYEMGTEQTYQ